MNTSNPSLYDQSCPRFILINNTTNQKIMDGSFINVEDFNDYLVLPDEPEGFDGAELVLQRDEQYHGFNYEYQVDTLKFGCDFGKGYLDNIFEQYGTDANVLFIYGYGALDNVSVLYVGGLDFNEYSTEDSEYTILNIRKDDFGNVLQSNFDIPQEVALSTSVNMYSKAIPKRVQYSIPRPDLGLASQFFNTLTSAYIDPLYNKGLQEPKVPQISKADPVGHILFNDGREGDNDLEVFTTYDFQVDSFNPITPERLKFVCRAREAGIYSIKVTEWVGLYLSAGFSSNYDFLKLKVIRTATDGTTILEAYTNLFKAKFNPTGLLDPDVVFQFEDSFLVTMGLDECLYVFIEIDTTSSTFPSLGFISSVVDFPFNYDIKSSSLAIDVETSAPLSVCKFEPTYNILNSVFKQASKLNYNILKSKFFKDSGCGSKFYLTNGANIAGIVSEPSKLNLKTSPSSIITSLTNLFNLGWGIEYDTFGRDIVRVEPAEYFYQDAEMLELDEKNISDYRFEIDTSKLYNEIEVGFSKYSKQRETDKGNTIDDFHTKHIYQTPLLKNKAKKTIITDIVLSAYEIEILRRKQFIKEGNSKNANLNTDDDIFGVQMTSAVASNILVVPNNIISVEDEYRIFAPYDPQATFTIGEQVDYTSRAGVFQKRTIVSISTFYFYLDFITGQFVFEPALDLTFAESLIGATTGSNDVLISTSTFVGTLTPESTQPFENVQNLLSPLTTYNLRYTPKRMLLQHAKMFMGAFRAKNDSSPIEFKQGDGNILLTTKFNSTEECILGDINRLDLVEGGNLELNEIFDNKYLFLPYKVTFNYPLSFEELNYIRNCMRGVSSDNNNYGYIKYTNPKGEIERIFLTEIKYNPSMEEASITGLIKGNYNYIDQ
jgi:hypothetical protein